MQFPNAYLNDWAASIKGALQGKSRHQALHERRCIRAGIAGAFVRNGKLTERLTHGCGDRPWRSRQPRGVS